jgi:flagellin-like hook-associated protein FlgL
MAIGLKSFKLKRSAVSKVALCFAVPWLYFGVMANLAYGETRGDNFIYVVQRGDTLLGIRAKFATDNVDWKRFAKANNITDAKRLPAGKELLIPIEWLASQSATATITAISGKATMNGQPLVAGTKVTENARISTEENSSVVIDLSDGSKLKVSSASTIVVDRLKQYHSDQIVEARVRLEKGRVEAMVSEKRKKPLDVLTPGATAAVRGTHFGVTIAEVEAGASIPKASVDVEKGNVVWSGVVAGGKESLPGGFGSSVNKTGSVSKAEALLEPIALSAFPKEVTKVVSTLPFDQRPGAASYRVSVASDNAFKDLMYETIVAKPELVLISKNDGPHYIRVKAISGNMVEGLTASTSVNVQARPVSPDGLNPPNATAVFEKEVNVSWLTVPGITYRLQAAQDPDFKNPILDSVTQLKDAKLSLTAGKTFWRVASIDKGKQGPFSDAKQIELKVAPNSPAPKTKDDVVELNTDIALSEKGNQLEVFLSKDADFKNIFDIKKLTSSPAIFALPAGTYFIKTRYLIEGFKPDAVPFSPVQTLKMVEPVRDTFGNTIQAGDGSSLILGR